MDITDAASIAAARESGSSLTDGLDGLVNNAGTGIAGPLELLPSTTFAPRSRSTSSARWR